MFDTDSANNIFFNFHLFLCAFKLSCLKTFNGKEKGKKPEKYWKNDSGFAVFDSTVFLFHAKCQATGFILFYVPHSEATTYHHSICKKMFNF